MDFVSKSRELLFIRNVDATYCLVLPLEHALNILFSIAYRSTSSSENVYEAKDGFRYGPAPICTRWKTTRQIKKDVAASRAARDAEFERKKAERAAKKTSMSERWAKNKSVNS